MPVSKLSPLKAYHKAEDERAAFDRRQAELRLQAATELGLALLEAGIRCREPGELVALAKAAEACGHKAALAALKSLPQP